MCLIGCQDTKVPADGVENTGAQPVIIPDYVDIVIPPNIAPMNFEVDMEGDEFVARVTGAHGKPIVASGNPIQWNMDEWRDLLENNKGKDLNYEIFVRNGDKWKLYAFTNHVALEDIDQYISYRLIEPSFVQYSALTLNQRDLTSFEETVIFNNAAPTDERRGQCMNCHVVRNHYRDKASQFHVRNRNGGTVIMAGDSVVKIDLKTDSTISAGVYPSWHPTEDLIAYSTNDTQQKFFYSGDRKIEVYDRASDLILYDMKTHQVQSIANDPSLLETFPSWSPDGSRLYYSVARYPGGVTPENIETHYRDIRYDIVCRDFDMHTRRFSGPDTVVNASAAGES
ncbi:MAG: hypothetical protein K2O47_06210, partial [Muribaculaceae bacterium]|nr:hypothetical protein [Muribaculaceae bacterium]